MGVVSQKLRDSAKGQPCTVNIAEYCNYDPETTVLAHLPSPVKGMGNKSHDFHAVFACSECHDAIDQRRLSRDHLAWYLLRALERTQRTWLDMGLLQVPATEKRKRQPEKIMPRGALFAANPELRESSE